MIASYRRIVLEAPTSSKADGSAFQVAQLTAEMGRHFKDDMTVVAIFVLGKGAVGFLAGWGLLNREGWGRVLALVLGFIALIHVPLGTALGIYTLWVLLPAESEAEYAKYQAANAA